MTIPISITAGSFVFNGTRWWHENDVNELKTQLATAQADNYALEQYAEHQHEVAKWLAAEAEWKKIRQFEWYSNRVAELEAVAMEPGERARLRELETVVSKVKAGEWHWDEAGCWEGGPLPTPNAANPDHLRFAADVASDLWDEGDGFVASFRAEADRIKQGVNDETVALAVARVMHENTGTSVEFEGSQFRNTFVARARAIVADPRLSITLADGA